MFKKKSILGIDIGTSYINIVKKNRRGQLIKGIAEPLSDRLIKQGQIRSERELALFIRRKLREAKIRGRKCGICLSSSQVIVRGFYFPAIIKDTLIDNIRYEISEYLPSGIDNYVVDYRILNNYTSSEENIMRVMAVAVPKDILDSYVRVFRKAGLKPVIMDIPANCQEIWYKEHISNLEDLTDKNRNVCLVYIETFLTRFTLLHEGIYYIDKISPAVGDENNEVNIELLIEEILGILNFYYARNPGHEINKIILMVDRNHGDISVKQIEQRTGISVYIIKMPIDDHNRICLPNAIGAVTRLEERTNESINLLKHKQKGKSRVYKVFIVLLAVFLAIGIAIRGFWIPICDKYKVIDEIKALEIEKDDYINVFNDYQDIKNEIEYLKDKKQWLDKVISDQKHLSHLLGVIQNCLPPNVYIIEFFTDDNSIRLVGRADKDDTIVQFLIALTNTLEFDEVFIIEISLEQNTGLRLFTLQCNVDIYRDLNPNSSKEE